MSSVDEQDDEKVESRVASGEGETNSTATTSSTLPSTSSQANATGPKGEPARPETPIELFKRMADSDSLQNRRLSASVNGLKTASVDDLVRGGRHQRRSTKMRFIVCTLGLMSLATSQMARMVLNFSITQMVNKQAVGKSESSADGSCPWPDEEELAGQQAVGSDSTLVKDFSDQIYGPHPREAYAPDGSALLAVATTLAPAIGATLPGPNGTHSERAAYEQFEWSIKNQSVLLGAFYYSYFVFMVLGGRMAETYGAKYVLLLGVAGSALISLATPWMTRNSFTMLVCSRILMGAIQSGVFPGMYALINKWLTMNEASIYAPLIKMNLRLGSVLASSLAGLIDGWPNVFYCTGGLCALWSVLWCLVATSEPAQSNWVSTEELAHINRKKPKASAGRDLENSALELKDAAKALPGANSSAGGGKGKQKAATPWLKILTSPSVIGLILVKLTFNYALDFMSILLPSYLDYVHHLSKEKRSGITTPMFTIQVVLIVFVGWLAKSAVQKRPLGMGKTSIRKLFQGIASFGLATSLLLFTFNNCNILIVALLLQLASFLSMFTAGGETMLPYDLSSKYPATIMAIANSVANLSAVTTTALAGLILGDQGGSYDRWNLLIYLIAGANVLGGLAFTVLVKAEPIDEDKEAEEEEEEEEKKEFK